MDETVLSGDLRIFNCKEINVTLNYSDPYRWLTFGFEVDGGHRVQLTSFLKTKEIEQAVISKLIEDLTKMLPMH